MSWRRRCHSQGALLLPICWSEYTARRSGFAQLAHGALSEPQPHHHGLFVASLLARKSLITFMETFEAIDRAKRCSTGFRLICFGCLLSPPPSYRTETTTHYWHQQDRGSRFSPITNASQRLDGTLYRNPLVNALNPAALPQTNATGEPSFADPAPLPKHHAVRQHLPKTLCIESVLRPNSRTKKPHSEDTCKLASPEDSQIYQDDDYEKRPPLKIPA